MAKPTGLQERKKGYYIRIAVPKDLREIIGKAEEVASLKTQEYNEACKRCRQKHVLIEAKFEEARKKLNPPKAARTEDQLSHYTHDQLKALTVQWIQRQDEKHEIALATRNIEDYEREGILETLKIDLGYASDAIKGDFSGTPDYGAKKAKEFLREHSIGFNDTSQSFKVLARFFRKATAEVIEKAIIRYQENRTPAFLDPDFSPDILTKSSPTKGITLGKLLEEYKTEKSKTWGKSAHRSFATVSNMLTEFLGTEKPLKDIDRKTSKEVRNFIETMPVNLRKSYPASKYTLIEAHRLAGKEGKKTVAPKTADNYITEFSSIMKYALQENYISENPATGLRIKDKTKAKQKRDAFTKEQLNQIFTAPLYTGCINPDRGYNDVGTCIPKDTARFWAPLISLWTGMRMTECLQLDISDIGEEDGIDVIFINESNDDTDNTAFEKRVKNAAL